MPDQPWVIASYAFASAVAAATVVWVLGPSLISSRGSGQSQSKGGAIGLINQANDCFINSVLQALVGSVRLRRYLAQESPRFQPVDGTEKDIRPENLGALEFRVVTRSLQVVLNRLAENTYSKKTISAAPFIGNVEMAFGARLNRQQQDAHELLQLVLDRLRDEYRACRSSQQIGTNSLNAERFDAGKSDMSVTDPHSVSGTSTTCSVVEGIDNPSENVFPCEGQLESLVECQTCHFKPTPQMSSFVVLSLMVPQQRSVSLDDCFNGIFMQEIIEDYTCDRCRLSHALNIKNLQIAKSTESKQEKLYDDVARLESAIAEDPERSLSDIDLPSGSSAPKTKTSKHTRMKTFPEILILHLSRSLFSTFSTKNVASVAFGEILQLGGLRRVHYELVSLITHLGGHNSGHYMAFRRQSATDISEEQPSAFLSEANGPYNDGLSEGQRMQPSHISRRKNNDRWWCISDERVRPCSTQDVLQMQNEAYIFIYERQTPASMLPQD